MLNDSSAALHAQEVVLSPNLITITNSKTTLSSAGIERLIVVKRRDAARGMSH